MARRWKFAGVTATISPPRPTADQWTTRWFGLLTGGLTLILICLLSFMIGSRPIPIGESLSALFSFDPANDAHLVVRELRIPRALIGILAGAALGAAGTIMQAATRNPLAEPGLLGINSGAAVAVVLGVASFQLSAIEHYVWLAALGAGAAATLVFFLGRAHESGTNPVRLVLAGAGVSIVLGAVVNLVLINAPDVVFDGFRTWAAGSLEGRGGEILPVLSIVVVAGLVLAIALGPSLNAIALGTEFGQALGANLNRTWILASLAIMLLAGAATAGAGPIGFVGLVAPHIARRVTGPDYRWSIPYSALVGAILLLCADVVGRVIAFPTEVAAGIVAALLGGPFFVVLVRRFRLSKL